jgi:N-acetylmuramic acid 6-phosphate (MurNAc-6-P) etherase
MVAMKPTNEKLRRRAIRIVRDIAGTTEDAAEDLLRKGHWNLPTALVAAKWGLDCESARSYLSKQKNNVALALSSPPERGGA